MVQAYCAIAAYSLHKCTINTAHACGGSVHLLSIVRFAHPPCGASFCGEPRLDVQHWNMWYRLLSINKIDGYHTSRTLLRNAPLERLECARNFLISGETIRRARVPDQSFLSELVDEGDPLLRISIEMQPSMMCSIFVDEQALRAFANAD